MKATLDHSHDRRFAGFTITELCAVLVTVVVLALLIAPVLARSKPGSSGTWCLNNLRQLSLAWKLYAEDCNGRLAPNTVGTSVGHTPDAPSWAGGWLDLSGSTSDNTNTLLLLDHSGGIAAYLGPYTRNASLYKCPSDRSLAPGQILQRVRSVSLNSRVGDAATAWGGSTRFRLYKTASSLVAPTPAQLFLFLDEREDSINDPSFLVDPDGSYQMIDFPGAYHSGGANFSYADGHAELHRWTDSRTVPPLRPADMSLNINLPNDPDVTWIQQHAAAPQ